MSIKRKIKITKPDDVLDIKRSELSLLSLLIQRNPERAKIIIERLRVEIVVKPPNALDAAPDVS